MKFNRILRLRRQERFCKFGVYKEIPTKKIFRRSSNLLWLILIFSLVLFVFVYKTNNSVQAHRPAMGVVVYSIFVLVFYSGKKLEKKILYSKLENSFQLPLILKSFKKKYRRKFNLKH